MVDAEEGYDVLRGEDIIYIGDIYTYIRGIYTYNRGYIHIY